MLRDESVGNAANLFYIRAHAAAFIQDLEIGDGVTGEVRLEQSRYHRRQKERVDPNQRRHQGIVYILAPCERMKSQLVETCFISLFRFRTVSIQESAVERKIDVTDVIHLDDYIPAQVETINKIARDTYQRTRSEFHIWFRLPHTPFCLLSRVKSCMHLERFVSFFLCVSSISLPFHW